MYGIIQINKISNRGCYVPTFSWDIYPDTRVVFFRFSAHPQDMYYIFPYVWHIYSEHLPTKLFVYILKMLQKFCIFLGHLPGCQGCFCWVFCIFSQDNYLDTRVVFFRCSAHAQDMYYIFTCVWHIYSGYLPTKFVYMLAMLWNFRIFPENLPGCQSCFFRVFYTSLGHLVYF